MKLSIYEKIGFGAGDMAIAIVMISMQLLLAYFYTDIYGLSAADTGVLFIVVRFVDALIDPVIGIFTDRINTRWGRYRPYLLFLAIPFGFAIYLMFVTPDIAYTGKLIWAYASYILLTIIYTFIAIPYVSLISVISDDPLDRLSANGYRFVMTKIAAFIVTIVVPLMAVYLGQGQLAKGYQNSMAIMGVLGAVLILACFFSTKERVPVHIEKTPIKQQVKLLLKNDQWIILGIVLTLIMCGGTIRASVSAYYAKYFLNGGDSLIPAFLTTGVIASVLAMVVSTWMTKFYDKIKLFRYSQIATFIFSALMYFMVGQGDIVLAFIFYFVVSFLCDLQLPIFWSSIAESVDYGELKTGTRVSGLAFGGILFFQKFGMGIAGGVLGFALAFIGYQPDVEQTASSLIGISLMMTLIPAIFHLLVGLLMFRFIINNQYYQEIKNRLLKIS
nr:MFS transporter [Providencia rettgeri]ELR5088795.1 MFS transporter [Providencia rettgeri]